jgi:pimeloyl-ACP methyl ester carboxylesterase
MWWEGIINSYFYRNGGCRIEALDVVHTLLPCEVSVLALDFAGSGLSEGEYPNDPRIPHPSSLIPLLLFIFLIILGYVSLGYWEQYDVATVVQYLREANRCSTIGLWGRSMGAVTAILYSMQDPSIACMILDSPFCSLQKVLTTLSSFQLIKFTDCGRSSIECRNTTKGSSLY